MIDQSDFSDVLCGTLHCQGGMEKPILPMGTSGVSLINTQVIMLTTRVKLRFVVVFPRVEDRG